MLFQISVGYVGHVGQSAVISPATGGGGQTALQREDDGTVSVLSLAATWTPTLTRESDGSITVTGNA